jgi:hypothetical protein
VTFEIFVKQLDGCGYMPGGFNCTCASDAMWLYRASQGRIHTGSCAIRTATGDRSGGTNLSQVEAVNEKLGVTGGKIYRPMTDDLFAQLIGTGRYGAIIQVSYAPLSGTKYDAWSGRFKGNHAMYVSRPGDKAGTWRVADPGADGRRAGIPLGYQDIPTTLMLQAAARLDIGGRVLGTGKVYAYFTPPDPVTVPSPHHGAVVTHATSLWNDVTKRWTFNGPNQIKVGTKLEIRSKRFPKGGVSCYPVTQGSYADNYPGYYVPAKNVRIVI